MKILTLGKGFVSDHLPYEIIDERLSGLSSMTRDMLEDYRPDVLVNCIGKTGRPNVDWCENHKEETYHANVVLPLMLAAECAKLDIHLIHIGSGCIYFGESPNHSDHLVQMMSGKNIAYGLKDLGWKESDFANPQSFYSKTKYACDLLLGEMPNVTTLRIRMPISTKNVPRNFINKVRGYREVIDAPNSVTFMDDLIACVDWVIDNSVTGLYHVTNPEPLSAAQVMREYQKYVPEHQFDVISTAQLDKLTVAKRSNCILNTDKLTQAGFRMTPTQEALEGCMHEFIKEFRKDNVK